MPPKPLPSETKARKPKRWTLKELRELAVGWQPKKDDAPDILDAFHDWLEKEAT